MAAAVVRATSKGRGTDIAILAIYLASLVAMFAYVHHSNDRTVKQLCFAVENLKAGIREQAQATIDSGNAYLKAHPGGTDVFPESAVLAQIAAKQKIVDRYPHKTCL